MLEGWRLDSDQILCIFSADLDINFQKTLKKLQIVVQLLRVGIVSSPEMPLFRKFPEIRKFEIERKNFRKNEIKIIDRKGGKVLKNKENVSKFPY